MNAFFLLVVTLIFASSLNTRDNMIIRGMSYLILAGLILGVIASLG